MLLDPAKSIIDKIGGPAVAAKVTRKHRTRVYRWAYPRSRGGTGGAIPNSAARHILQYAERHRITLDPSEFLAEPAPAKANWRGT